MGLGKTTIYPFRVQRFWGMIFLLAPQHGLVDHYRCSTNSRVLTFSFERSFSKYFLFKNILKYFFYFLKIIFNISILK
jgi:hypothetical protein